MDFFLFLFNFFSRVGSSKECVKSGLLKMEAFTQDYKPTSFSLNY